ncbi:hypothetical protein SAMN04488024_11424 [Pedobacter soli]|uniref:Uncharacterized protein n=1 Tax=Pedobacter soli TaxID=390242 RepID=A0A1G7B4A2_9SPHI|nr:hypothetical protein SAMN04488024_11424 [Pedobacter soli]
MLVTLRRLKQKNPIDVNLWDFDYYVLICLLVQEHKIMIEHI